MNSNRYTDRLRHHYELYFGVTGNKVKWTKGSTHKLHPDFYILEIESSKRRAMWAYATVGMSLDRNDNNLIELITYSPTKDSSRVELLTVNASFHRNSEALNLHHTVFIGQLTNFDTTCDHGFISLPYLDGKELEIFQFYEKEIHCYWYIPITKAERDFKMMKGCNALEDLFEEKQFDHLDMRRKSVVE